MTEKLFDAAEEAAIKQFAQQRGYKTVKDYMRSLIEHDAQQRGVPSPLSVAVDDDDDSIRAAIKQGYQEARSGDVLTEQEFWKAVTNDD